VYADPVERINGITLSRDEKTLYVATQSRVAKTTLSIADLAKDGGEYILAFDVQPDGTVKNRRNFAKYEIVTQRPNGLPDVRFGGDGLAIDGQDRVYAATAAGIQVFSPQGKHLGTIPVSRNPNNLAFAGPDKKTLLHRRSRSCVPGRNARGRLQGPGEIAGNGIRLECLR
jgi:gluconolactonase